MMQYLNIWSTTLCHLIYKTLPVKIFDYVARFNACYGRGRLSVFMWSTNGELFKLIVRKKNLTHMWMYLVN